MQEVMKSCGYRKFYISIFGIFQMWNPRFFPEGNRLDFALSGQIPWTGAPQKGISHP